ncbi:HEPN domain-containing protein [Desulfococcaceae bacterium HSG8]|nr:HEPN domain-containing protein [Desulfococcaceae bacterium HSG8]
MGFKLSYLQERIFMADRTVIDSMYEDFTALIEHLEQSGEFSFRDIADNTFKKTLVLSAASFFEDKIQKILLNFVSEQTKKHKLIVAIVKSKAILRQYHTYFDWDGKNANRFFSLFGSDFKESASSDVRNNEDLDLYVKNFLELGSIRNKLVHLNFASIPLDNTCEEIYSLYKKASGFVEYIETKLRTYNSDETRQDQGITRHDRAKISPDQA